MSLNCHLQLVENLKNLSRLRRKRKFSDQFLLCLWIICFKFAEGAFKETNSKILWTIFWASKFKNYLELIHWHKNKNSQSLNQEITLQTTTTVLSKLKVCQKDINTKWCIQISHVVSKPLKRTDCDPPTPVYDVMNVPISCPLT